MFFEKRHPLNASEPPKKIIHEDGFNFVDEDDDEQILLYEDYINEPAQQKDFEPLIAQDNELFDIDADGNPQPLGIQDEMLDFNLNNEPDIEVKPLINFDEKESVQPETKVAEKPQVEKEVVVEPVVSSNQAPSNVVVEPTPEIKPEPVVVSVASIPEPAPETHINYAFDEQKQINAKPKDTYFIDPKRTNSQRKQYDNNDYQLYKTKDMTMTENVDEKNYSQNIVLSGSSYRDLFHTKYVFSVLSLTLWCLVSVTIITVLALGIFAQIKHYDQFAFKSLDYLPLSIGIVISLSFLIYEVVNTAKYRIYRNEFIAGKKVDANDFDHVNAIYKHNKIWQGFLTYFLPTLIFLFGLTIFIIYLANNQSWNFSHNRDMYLSFYGSIGVFGVLFVFIVLSLIGFVVLNKIIEKDAYYEKSLTIGYYKDISKTSYKIGLITFCCVTVVGICIYLIVDAILKKQRQTKKDKATCKYK